MRTLFQISELDDGRLDFYGVSFSGFGHPHSIIDRYIHELNKASWAAKFWISLFGAAQQLQDWEMSFFNAEQEPYHYDEDDEFLPDLDDDTWQESQIELVSKPPSSPEKDLEWQKRKMAVSAGLTEWRQEMAARKRIHDWEVIKHTVLADIARKMPLSRKELMDVRGVGKATWDRYGEEILTAVQKALFSLEKPESTEAGDGGRQVSSEKPDSMPADEGGDGAGLPISGAGLPKVPLPAPL